MRLKNTILLKPLITISIIIPVFNGANYLEGAIQSALNQTYQNIEIIVINDGSTDATADLVTQFIHEHPQLTVELINQDNAGLAAARNAGIGHAKAPFIAFLDADHVEGTRF